MCARTVISKTIDKRDEREYMKHLKGSLSALALLAGASIPLVNSTPVGASNSFSCATSSLATPNISAKPTVSTCTTVAPDGSKELIQIPSNFNGNLILYSHGYVFSGNPLTAVDAFSAGTASILLAEGDALAGSSYAKNGWGAVQAALVDQITTLNDAKSLIATNDPAVLGQTLSSNAVSATYATGVSLGGMITAALVQQNPTTFTGAMPACGVVGGGVTAWNRALYSEVAFKTLFDPTGSLLTTGISPGAATSNYASADAILAGALSKASSSAATAARLALVAALGSVPTWFSQAPSGTPTSTEIPFQSSATAPNLSTPSGLQSALLGQADWMFYVDFPFAFGPGRSDLESVAGGNPSWTNGVNYAQVLANSPDYAEVQALYAAAGISLSSDLASIQGTTPISANPSSLHYLQSYFSFNGNIQIPVLTMHTTNDGLVPPENETSYANAVAASGNSNLLNQVYVNDPGHCAFSAAEYASGLHGLMSRVATGSWSGATPAALNAYAAKCYSDPSYNATADSSPRTFPSNVYPAPPAFDTSGFTPGVPLGQSQSGYLLAAKDGGVFAFNGSFRGSMASVKLNAPVVGIARTPDGQGYWLVASDGGVFSFGDAKFQGSLGGTHLNAPIVGIASTPDGKGYWLVASDGGVFSFGDAKFQGSLGGTHLNAPIVGIASTPDGKGYWLVASDGGVFSFGDAKFQGSLGGTHLNAPIVGIASSGSGQGYWLVASDGGVFSFGDAKFQGSLGGTHLNAPIVGIKYYAPLNGYSLVGADGGVFNFNSSYDGGVASIHLNAPIAAIA